MQRVILGAWLSFLVMLNVMLLGWNAYRFMFEGWEWFLPVLMCSAGTGLIGLCFYDFLMEL